MVKIITCCDVCGNPLPIKTVETMFGTVESVKTFKSKEWDISSIAPYLCELCALKIDNAILELRREYLGERGADYA